MRALSHLSFRRWLPGMLAAVALWVVAGVPAAWAVKPYRESVYRQKQAPLKKGFSVTDQRNVPFRFKAGKSMAVSHHGVSPQFQRQHWSWGRGKRSPMSL